MLLYAAYTYGAGWRVLGYLPGYASEEGINTGQGIFALRAWELFGPVPGWAPKAYAALAGVGLLGLAAFYMLGRVLPVSPAARIVVIGHAAAVLSTASMVAVSPHYPWYLGWLSLFACFAPYRSTIWLSTAGVLMYLDPYHRETIYPWLIYGPCIALAAVDAARAFAVPQKELC